MKRKIKNKIIIIIALMIPVIGMSIGFAVFSDVLTISSSATVTPNEEDFKMTIYGLTDKSQFDGDIDLTKWSTTTAYQDNPNTNVFENNEFSATINNQNFTINNLSAQFTSPGEYVTYWFVIKNEGAYDAHVSFSEDFIKRLNDKQGWYGTCTPGEGTTASLVNDACQSIIALPEGLTGSNGEAILETMIESSYELSINNYIVLGFVIAYDGTARADGPFTIEFDPVEFVFSTTSN